MLLQRPGCDESLRWTQLQQQQQRQQQALLILAGQEGNAIMRATGRVSAYGLIWPL